MRRSIAFAALGAALFAGTAAAAAPSVEIKDAVARVTVIPEDRADIKVEVVRASKVLPLKIRREGQRTIIDGDIGHGRIWSCAALGGKTRVGVRGVGQIAYEDMPQVRVRTPRTVEVGAGGAVFGTIDRSAAATLASAGCGDWTVANVAGPLKVSLAGSGDIRTGSAGSAQVRVAGSGDVATQAIRGGASVVIGGSGDVTLAQVGGDLDAKVGGSGEVRVLGGRSGAMTASVAGSGDIIHKGAVASLDARIMGSGDVHAARVAGSVHKSVMGSGDVTVGP